MLHMLLTRLWIQITADRKRFAALCVVLLVGLLLWSRIILISRAPKVAMADEPPNAAATTGKSAPGSGKTATKSSSNASGKAPRKTAAKSADAKVNEPSDKPLPIVAIALDRDARRDPFRISERYFPRPNSLPGNEQDAAKLSRQPSDDAQGAQERLEAQLQALVARFQLEAVMQGGPMAIINGRTYRIGDEIPAVDAPQVRFRLVEVRPLAVTLACNGRRYELRMPGPKIAPR